MKKTTVTNVPNLSPPDLDGLSHLFVEAFPPLSADDQKLSLELYRLLLDGKPVALDRLAQVAGISSAAAHQILSQWPGVVYDGPRNVLGFWGLSVERSPHRFQVGPKVAYTWCAWDTLFIPQLLNATANVTSTCAVTGESIRLTVSPARIEAIQPPDVVISFLMPDANELRNNITASFCRFVRFFRSSRDAEAWLSAHENTFLLSLEDAFRIGEKKNAARFAAILDNR